MAFHPSPGQLDAAKRILAHNHKRPYGPGSRGTTVRAIKIFLASKGYDPGKINGEWDSQMTSAFAKAVPGDARQATPSVLKKLSKEFGKPGPRPSRANVMPAAMTPIMPGEKGATIRDVLSAVPPASGVGDQTGMPTGEEAYASARNADLAAEPQGLTGELLAGDPGGPSSDAEIGSLVAAQPQGYPKAGAPVDMSSLEPPAPGVPPAPLVGDAETGKDDAAEGGVEEPPAPGVPPDPAQAMKTREMGALGSLGGNTGGVDPAMLGKPPIPSAQGMPAPDDMSGGGLTGADLVSDGTAPDDTMGQATGSMPDMTSSPELGALGTAGSGNPPMGVPPALGDLSGGGGPLPMTGPDMTATAGSGNPPMGAPAGVPPPSPAGGVPIPSPRPSPSPGPSAMGGTQYKIQAKDTLWDIAEREYGDPRLWPILAQANPQIKNPNLIYAGKTITIPDLAGT